MDGLAQRQAEDLQPGSASDFSASGVKAYLTVVTVLSVLAVALRFWSRSIAEGRHRQFFWWDDWMALISLASSSLPRRRVSNSASNDRQAGC